MSRTRVGTSRECDRIKYKITVYNSVEMNSYQTKISPEIHVVFNIFLFLLIFVNLLADEKIWSLHLFGSIFNQTQY